MADTSIEWTDRVWNPSTGCDRVSPGCDHCYAMTMAKRLKGMGSAKYQQDGDPRTSGPGFLATTHESELDAPLRWRKPAKVFVNSMSDLFHDNISDDFIARVWAVMAATPQHTYQILTKRHARMRALLRDDSQIMLEHLHREEEASTLYDALWPLPNVWLGVSVETQQWADIRIPALLDTPAAVRWLSCEPLLGPIKTAAEWWGDLWCQRCGEWGMVEDSCGPAHDAMLARPGGIDWVVCGGESGPGARPMELDWARSLDNQCLVAGVPFYFKQLGAVLARQLGAKGKGTDPADWPEEFPREYPREEAHRA